MTPEEQAMLDYIQAAYPTGLRTKARDTNSLVWKYDDTRAYTIAQYMAQRVEGIANLMVSTADENGVEEWEKFLKLPTDTSLSLVARKAKILVRLAGNPATIANLKKVVEAFIGEGRYEITELWKLTPFDPVDTWTYVVDLYDPQPAWFINEMVSILNAVHPAHCTLQMSYTRPILDAIGTQDAVTHVMHEEFIRGITGSPAATDATWTSNATPLIGSYWS